MPALKGRLKLAERAAARLLGPAAREEHPALASLREDAGGLFKLAGYQPDPWQWEVLRSAARRLMLCASRQAGKSSVVASIVLREALLRPGATALLMSPSERQSGELMAKVRHFYDLAGRPVKATKTTELQLYLSNRSRIVALPDNEKTVRGFSGVTTLVLDEAARIRSSILAAVRPAMAVAKGRLIVLSTPFGVGNWFADEWHDGVGWERHKATADSCPRIDAEFLAEEKVKLGEKLWKQEYFVSFESSIGAYFPWSDLQAAVVDGEPLFSGGL